MGHRSASPHPGSNPTDLTNICFLATVNSPCFLGETCSEVNLAFISPSPCKPHPPIPQPRVQSPWTHLKER